uniref:G-protein coupled receptors family 1 profile domain-containing protein n=2 Tax=Acrobeloides nanus TaxID=290746 RepID=A0A914E0V0_9BILA
MTPGEIISYVLVIYIQPVLCCIGFILNTACIIVFCSSFSHSYYRKTSLLVYLIGLSICNAFQLLISTFVLVLPAAEQFIDGQQFEEECHLLRIMNAQTVRMGYPLLMSANYASIWIVTFICVSRYQSLCPPWTLWKKRLHFSRRSKLILFLILILSIALNIPRYWEMELHERHLIVTSLRFQLWYKIVQEGIIYGTIVYGLPLVGLAVINYRTLQLVRADKRERRRPSAEYRSAVMTMIIFSCFFVCTTLSALIRLVLIVVSESIFLSPKFLWLPDLSNLLMNMNALAMPIVCFVFTRGFRDIFFVIRYAPSTDQVAAETAEKNLLNKSRSGHRNSSFLNLVENKNSI